MPTYQIHYSVKRRFSTLMQSIKIFAMTEGTARKMFFNWAKSNLKTFAKILSIEEL